jgi:hypothetical protein
MKGPIAVALATGTLAVIAFGGMAMASEGEDLSASAVVEATAAPDESDGETSEDSSPSDIDSVDTAEETGLECVLVPIEEAEVVSPIEEAEVVGDPDVTPTIDELLAANDIECTGTGNERSAEVALVPRYLAHSDDYTGAEKGLAISTWAKSQSNKKSDDQAEPEVPEEGDGTDTDVDPAPTESTAPASPGRSGDAHGNSGSQRGNGRGR